MLSDGFQWPPFSLNLLKVFGEICMAFVLNWTSERKCLSESKWNQVFILGDNMERDKQPKRNPPLRSRQHLPSANWPVCENQWSHQARAILILTRRAERQLGVLHREAGRNVERQKMSLLTDTIPVSYLVTFGPGRDSGVGWLYIQPLRETSSFFSEEWPALVEHVRMHGLQIWWWWEAEDKMLLLLLLLSETGSQISWVALNLLCSWGCPLISKSPISASSTKCKNYNHVPSCLVWCSNPDLCPGYTIGSEPHP